MTEPVEPVHGCTINGQPAIPILISEYNQLIGDLAQAQAAAERVRAAIHIADTEDVTDWQRGYRACSANALRALAEPKDPAP